MKNNITPYKKDYDEENEINLYELLDIILKRKMIIIIVTVLGTILSFGSALYYSKNISKEKYAQNFTVNYNIFNEDELIKTGNLKTIEILTLLNNNDVVDEFFEIDKLREIYEKKNKKILSGNEEILRKRLFLKKILTINLQDEKQNELSFGVKKYIVTADVEKKSDIQNILIDKVLEIVERKVDTEFVHKLERIDSFNKENIEKYLLALKENDKDFNILEEVKDVRVENVDSIIKYINPSLYVTITENINNYKKSIELDKKIEIVKEKMKDNNLLEVDTSIYMIEKRGYAKIILLIGALFSVVLGICLAFVKEFWNGYKNKHTD
ncbi:Wzz/FepE/Etk N-terminal domain-containing protein [Fusobacterium sp. PH5-44]|uniref:Wzz/FepE/Etk N-terminal domain-containing protein n=1 Tax=unclassified Fusobacterium TaxID=2648384 RepID=UPI003D250E24